MYQLIHSAELLNSNGVRNVFYDIAFCETADDFSQAVKSGQTVFFLPVWSEARTQYARIKLAFQAAAEASYYGQVLPWPSIGWAASGVIEGVAKQFTMGEAFAGLFDGCEQPFWSLTEHGHEDENQGLLITRSGVSPEALAR